MARLYSNLKFLRHSAHLAALAVGDVAAPVHVRIKPINRCNHNCWYCAYRSDNLALGDGMDVADRIPAAKMFEIVEDVIAMGVRAVTFSGGGEPLLYRELPEVVRRLGEANVKVATLTNGSNLQGAMAEAFAQYGTWVRISLDAWDDASYAAARSAPIGAFTKLIGNIRAFTARKSACVLGVSLIVGVDNHLHIAEICALLKDAGVGHVKISGAVVSNDGQENNRYHDLIKTETCRQIDLARVFEGDDFSIVDHYHELEERFDKDYQSCPFLQFLTVIGADCRVYSCQDKAYTDSGLLGSIANQRFQDFWFSLENHQAMQRINPSVRCRHHCVAHQKNLVLHEFLTIDVDHASFV